MNVQRVAILVCVGVLIILLDILYSLQFSYLSSALPAFLYAIYEAERENVRVEICEECNCA